MLRCLEQSRVPWILGCRDVCLNMCERDRERETERERQRAKQLECI